MLRRHDPYAMLCVAVTNSISEVMVLCEVFHPHHPLGFKAREIIGQYLQELKVSCHLSASYPYEASTIDMVYQEHIAICYYFKEVPTR